MAGHYLVWFREGDQKVNSDVYNGKYDCAYRVTRCNYPLAVEQHLNLRGCVNTV